MDNDLRLLLAPAIDLHGKKAALLGDLLAAAYPKDPGSATVVANLAEFVSQRVVSILILVEHDRLWDAEILCRPMVEAAVRAVFICDRNPELRTSRVAEYSEQFADLNLLKQIDKVRRSLPHLHDDVTTRNCLRPIVDSTRGIEEALRASWPKERRRELEQRWSFAALLQALNREREAGGGVHRFDVLADLYNRSSHLLHADETGVQLEYDRKTRDPAERARLESAHAARLLSDIIMFPMLVASEIAEAFELDARPIAPLWTTSVEFVKVLKVFITEFAEGLSSS